MKICIVVNNALFYPKAFLLCNRASWWEGARYKRIESIVKPLTEEDGWCASPEVSKGTWRTLSASRLARRRAVLKWNKAKILLVTVYNNLLFVYLVKRKYTPVNYFLIILVLMYSFNFSEFFDLTYN